MPALGSLSPNKPHRIARAGLSRAFQISNIFTRMSVLENIRTAV